MAWREPLEMEPSSTTTVRPLKIAVLGSTYPRFHEDGQVPWLRESVNRLAARGHKVTVIASAFEGSRHHAIDGIPVYRFRYAPKRIENLTHDEGGPSKLRRNPLYQLLGVTYILGGMVQAFSWARRERFDVIQIHWPFPHGLIGLAAARACGGRTVATCHGAELAMARRKGWVRRILRFCLRQADRLSCNSSHTRDEIKTLCDREAQVIPYGATVRSAGTPKAPRSAGQPATLLFSGRLIQRKGLPYLLRALPRVLQEKSVKLLVTGEGDCRQAWEALAGELNLSAHVEFLGFVSNARLAQLYRDCDLYVHPAIFDDRGDTEGLGVVLIEALQNARPVVASAVGGIVDVIQHEETGLLVPEKDERALADAILRLLHDPALAARLGEAGRKRAEWIFDWDRITAETEDLFNDACAAAAVAPIPPGVFAPTAPVSQTR